MAKQTRGRAALAGAVGGGLMLLGANAGLAQSVPLPAGRSLAAPATTNAADPSLGGRVMHDTLVPFTIRDGDGTVLCAGQLQDRVVQSNATGRLDFYLRIRDTWGSGAIGQVAASSFGGLAVRVGYRTDGLGTVAPRRASRSGGTGTWVRFELNDRPVSCARGEESVFMLVRTEATEFHDGGEMEVSATAGTSVLLPGVMP